MTSSNDPDIVTASAVVVRRSQVDARYPWPHYVGDLASDKDRTGAEGTPDHPFRTGEYLRRISLKADMSFLEIGTVVATLCDYNSVAPARCALMPIARMLSEQYIREPRAWVVSGGVEVCVGGEHVVGPQCCCGLECWREWQVFAQGGPAPWTGHSPDALLLRLESGALELGYQDEGAPMTIPPEALRAALDRVEIDLQGFVEALLRWGDRVVPRLSQAFASRFAETMDIGPHDRHPSKGA
jgi:hypothetical protein